MDTDKYPHLPTFTLGAGQRKSPYGTNPSPPTNQQTGLIDMSSMSAATSNLSNEPPQIPTTTTDDLSTDTSSKLSPMETGDVSTSKSSLKPKSRSNPFGSNVQPHETSTPETPYPDQHIPRTTNSLNVTKTLTDPTVSSSISSNSTSTTAATTLDSTPANSNNQKKSEFEELTQEEIEIINQEIEKQNQQDQWQPVNNKHTIKHKNQTERTMNNESNNRFSVLDDDIDQQTTESPSIPTDPTEHQITNNQSQISSTTTSTTIESTTTTSQKPAPTGQNNLNRSP